MTRYEIVDEALEFPGDFSGDEIEALVKSGQLDRSAKVRKTHSGKIVDAYIAKISADANDIPAEPTKGGFFLGAALVVAGIGISAFLFFAREEGESVRGKLFIIPVLCILGGAKLIAMYSKSLTSACSPTSDPRGARRLIAPARAPRLGKSHASVRGG